MFLCEFCKISKKIFSYITPLVAASEWALNNQLHAICHALVLSQANLLVLTFSFPHVDKRRLRLLHKQEFSFDNKIDETLT